MITMFNNDVTCFENTFSYPDSKELNMYYCGKRINTPAHSYGPEIRKHYLIVYIKEGCATLLSHKNKLRLTAGNIFVMFPNKEVHYVVDKNVNWSISWIGVHGTLIDKLIEQSGLSPERPICNVKSVKYDIESILEAIYQLSFSKVTADKINVISMLYNFFSILISNNSKGSPVNYVEEALSIIEYNYEKDITIENIAERLSVNKNYLSRLFRTKKNFTLKEYLIHKRIERAKELLQNTNASILQVSNSVGYDDQLYFSRIFKKKVGMSPTEYKKDFNNIQ